MSGTTTADARREEPTAQDAPGARAPRAPRERWLTPPTGEAAARLTLFALVIALQNVIELPRPLIRDRLGRPLTGLLITAALAASLALLIVALRASLPRWRWPRSRAVHVAVLVVTLAAVPTGLGQTGQMLASGFRAPMYPNDGTTLDHYAAQELLWGHNPYASVDIVSAVRYLRQDAEHTTPLGQGRFAALYPDSMPTAKRMRDVFATLPAGDAAREPEFESHVSYPALSFLALVPLVWAGVPSVVPFFVLCLFALVALIALAAPPRLRPWIVLLALADAPLLDATVAGDLDIFYILLLFVAWRYWRRPLVSAVTFGLAAAAKQIAWFYVPFYAVYVARQYGWREAGRRLAVAGAVFAVINAPFFLNNSRAYLAGVLAPQMDRMFPQGNGLVGLSTSGLLPLLPAQVYTALFALAMLAAIALYWRFGAERPELGFVLGVLPLFFAWRSLTTYFYFLALPALGLLLARLRDDPSAATEAHMTGGAASVRRRLSSAPRAAPQGQ